MRKSTCWPQGAPKGPMQGRRFERRLRPTHLTGGARNGTLAPLATSTMRKWGPEAEQGQCPQGRAREAEMNVRKGAVEAPSEESLRA
jgi:hypothetical protein